VGRLIVIEGLDGAGKATLAARLDAAFAARGATVARLGFPRYEDDVHAELVRDALHGRAGDLGDSVHGMALLFALDRRAAADGIRAALATHDVLLVDRYIASNAAYGAARLHQDASGEFVDWVRSTEVERFGVPRPDHQLLLDVPEHVAAGRAERRGARDAFETDEGLQKRTAAVYAQFAAMSWLSPWTVLEGVAGPDVGALSADLLR
jgi:dTMP kinase